MLNEPQMLPAFVRSMEQMQDLLRTEQAELDRTEAAIRDATDQLYINSTTWTLARWERLFGLPSNDSVPAELRREQLLAKRNARPPASVEYIRLAAEQMTGQQVTIIEQPGNYAFILRIHLNDIYSLDLAALRARIDELKPAHLTYTVEQYDPSGIDVRQRYAVMVGEAKHYTLYPHQGGDGNGDMG